MCCDHCLPLKIQNIYFMSFHLFLSGRINSVKCILYFLSAAPLMKYPFWPVWPIGGADAKGTYISQELSGEIRQHITFEIWNIIECNVHVKRKKLCANEREPESLLTHFIFSMFITSHAKVCLCPDIHHRVCTENVVRNLSAPPANTFAFMLEKIVEFFQAKNYYFPCHCRQCGREFPSSPRCAPWVDLGKARWEILCRAHGKYVKKDADESTWKMHAHRHLNRSHLQRHHPQTHTHVGYTVSARKLV